jgi:hypothetical protein
VRNISRYATLRINRAHAPQRQQGPLSRRGALSRRLETVYNTEKFIGRIEFDNCGVPATTRSISQGGCSPEGEVQGPD